MHWDLNRYEEAIAAYNKVLKIKPDYQDAWFIIGWMLEKLGRYSDAIAAYDEALQIKPDSTFFAHKGIALSDLGRYEEAIVALR